MLTAQAEIRLGFAARRNPSTTGHAGALEDLMNSAPSRTHTFIVLAPALAAPAHTVQASPSPRWPSSGPSVSQELRAHTDRPFLALFLSRPRKREILSSLRAIPRLWGLYSGMWMRREGIIVLMARVAHGTRSPLHHRGDDPGGVIVFFLVTTRVCGRAATTASARGWRPAHQRRCRSSATPLRCSRCRSSGGSAMMEACAGPRPLPTSRHTLRRSVRNGAAVDEGGRA